MLRHKLLLPLLLLLLLAGAIMAQTSTPDPTLTVTPTPRPTEPPAVLIIQPTPQPTAPPPDSLGELIGQVWAQNRQAIILAIITTLLTGILIGVFIKSAAEKVTGWAGQLFHYLFDNYASLPIIRWFYEKEYRQTLAETVQNLQGGNLVQRTIRLDQMYVPSLLTEETMAHLQRDYVDQFRGREELRRRRSREAIGPWDALRKLHRFVLLGDPGSGKTTCLYHIAFLCARRQRAEVKDHFPIFVHLGKQAAELTKLARLEEGLPRVLATDYRFPNADKLIERLLRQGRCLILLDGLDEVADVEDHRRLVELVQAFADRYVRGEERRGRRNILIVSSRIYSYEKGPQLAGFPRTRVVGFRREAVRRFAHNWFEGNTVLADELLHALEGNERFLELARSPLLLLLIAHHYERERNLPNLRAELYRHCIRTRITQWNTLRGTHRGRFGEDKKWRLLRALALHIFEQERQRLLQRGDLLAWLEAHADSLQGIDDVDGETLLDEIARTSGLIQELAIDRYGFSHLTLQEYFAAEAADRLGPDQGADLLSRYLERPAWKEVILLYCGLADNVQPLLQRLVGRAERAAGDPALWLLAGNCLAEGARFQEQALRRQVVQALVGLMRRPEPALTPTQSGQAAADLKLFAADLLADEVAALLPSDAPEDWLLAEQLLPEQVDDGLRQALQARLAVAAGSEKAEMRQAVVAALGRLGAESGSFIILQQGLSDPDPAARAEATLALARLGHVDDHTAGTLRQIAQTDPADAARHAALEALLALRREAEVGMVFVPAGEFLMGSSEQDRQADNNEKPQHKLYLPAYFMDRTPVTNAQYRRFMEAGGYANPDYWPEAIAAQRWREGQYVDYDGKPHRQPLLWDDKTWTGDEQPVVGVCWYEALAYARWAGKRLPTEAEWEKAARGDDGRIYPWGNEWAADRANALEVGLQRTTPVGRYSPAGDSLYGAVDMAGNVWEWCSTRWWNESQKEYNYPYTPDDGREDLSGNDDVVRILRGGSWASDQEAARCAVRSWNYPWYGRNYRGFRCCCTPFSLPGSDF